MENKYPKKERSSLKEKQYNWAHEEGSLEKSGNKKSINTKYLCWDYEKIITSKIWGLVSVFLWTIT